MEPGLFWLTAEQMESFAQGARIAREAPRDVEMYLSQVFGQTFAKGAQAAIPAWSADALEMIATRYDGPHAARIKYMAACLALGRPIEPPGGDGKGNGGGEKIPADPAPKPRPGSPAKVRQLAGVRS
jgi:hypothetical protein